MKNIKVIPISVPTAEDLSIITDAARMTQVRDYEFGNQPNTKLVVSLIKMGHWAPLEFVDMTVLIRGCSRTFLAQITRHRLCSFMSSSQQYQLHNDFHYVIPEEFVDNSEYSALMDTINTEYCKFEKTVGRDVARYVLPNACRVDLLIKANLRQWLSVIIPQRICHRNTPETKHIMKLICELLPYNLLTGPACLTMGICDQGKMACSTPYTCKEELLP